MSGNEKREIKVNSFYLIAIISTFLISFLIVYATEHYAKITFSIESRVDNVEKIPGGGERITYENRKKKDRIISINFETVFGSYLEFNGYPWTYIDIYYSGDFYKYSNESKYYYKATIKEFKYVTFIWIGLMIVIVFINEFKIRLIK